MYIYTSRYSIPGQTHMGSYSFFNWNIQLNGVLLSRQLLRNSSRMKQWEDDIFRTTHNSLVFKEICRIFPSSFSEIREIARSSTSSVRSARKSSSRASLTVCFRPQSSITNLPSGSSLRSQQDLSFGKKGTCWTCQKNPRKVVKTMVSRVSLVGLQQKKTESSKQDLGSISS